MQFFFVDIPIDVAKERTIFRYMNSMNSHLEDNKHVGGRYLPDYVLNSYKSKTGKYSSQNEETLIKIKENLGKNGLPDPIVYDNSGDSPVELEFNEFSKKYYL